MSVAVPVLGIAAFSGTGKTSLLLRLIPVLKDKGLRIAVLKHAHHDFQIDLPGKDSYEIRQSGASQMLISSAKRFVKISEQTEEKSLADCLLEVDTDNVDLILVEGYKTADIKKIELHRPRLGFPLLCLQDKNIIALASDAAVAEAVTTVILDLNDTLAMADFIVDYWRKSKA